jgi:integrase
MRKLRGVIDNYVIRNALLFSAHVWQRPSEIREAHWSEFDLDAATWRIPAARMKLADDHLVPLSRQVVELLRQHQGIVGSHGLLFPGRKYGQPISEGTLTSRLNTMGYDGKHSPHGFRAMARTICEEVLHIDPRYLEKQLAHEVDRSGLNGAYNRAEFWDQRVKMMQTWSDWLDAQT